MLRLHAEFFLFGGSFQLLLFELLAIYMGRKWILVKKPRVDLENYYKHFAIDLGLWQNTYSRMGNPLFLFCISFSE